MALRKSLGVEEGTQSNTTDANYTKKASRTYVFLFDDADDDIFVRNNCLIAMYSAHPTDPKLVATNIDVSEGESTTEPEIGDCREWYVKVDYENFQRFGLVPGGPLAQPPSWTLVPYLKSEAAWKDYNDIPILNTAGDPFNPPVEYERLCWTFTVRRNEANPDFGALLAASNRVNIAPWLLWGEKEVKSLPIAIPSREYDGETDQYYYPVEYSFDIDPDNWKVKIPNLGFREQKSGKLVKITDESGDPVDDPVLLGATGAKLAYPLTNASQVIIREFDVIEPMDFSIFNLDGIFTA